MGSASQAYQSYCRTDIENVSSINNEAMVLSCGYDESGDKDIYSRRK